MKLLQQSLLSQLRMHRHNCLLMYCRKKSIGIAWQKVWNLHHHLQTDLQWRLWYYNLVLFILYVVIETLQTGFYFFEWWWLCCTENRTCLLLNYLQYLYFDLKQTSEQIQKETMTHDCSYNFHKQKYFKLMLYIFHIIS